MPPNHRPCAFCLSAGQIKPSQVLLRSNHFYLCAPRGQLMEGYLAVAPYDCVGSMSLTPAEWLDELVQLRSVVLKFYRESYGVTHATLYEQGRGGRGARYDPVSEFPLHAHLCCLPTAMNLHAIVARRYTSVTLESLTELAHITHGQPYLYVESPDASGEMRMAAYLPRTDDEAQALECERLKPAIAASLGMPDRADWRAYPGDAELSCVLNRFASFVS